MSDGVRKLLEDLMNNEITIDDAEKLLHNLSLTRVSDFAALDIDRANRSGIPEVVLADSKENTHFLEIIKELISEREFALATRVDEEKKDLIAKNLNDYEVEVLGVPGHYTVLIRSEDWVPPEISGRIAVLTAGTSDIPFSVEVEAIARVMGVDVLKFYDVGVAGIHRLVEPIEQIIKNDVDVVVVLAGMEGALPTVVASLLNIPVIGLPVPVGYGYGGKGETALASMLQSCAPGLAVVNIGNGLGAGALAGLIARRCGDLRKRLLSEPEN